MIIMNKKYNIKHFSPGILLLLLLACPPAFAIKQQKVYVVEKPAKQTVLQIHTPENKYLYNGKELVDDEGINLYDYGFRFYDAALGRWHVIDNKAEEYMSWSTYAYVMNNPIKLYDIDGNSTWTDEDGNVIAVYDDDDLGVYQLANDQVPEEYATYEGQTKTVTDDEGNEKEVELDRLSDGEKKGETEYWDEFRAHDNETGETLTSIQEGATIMFWESWNYAIDLNNRAANEMDLSDVAAKSLPGKNFDIKSSQTYAPHGPATGKRLNGKYATACSAGNYLAGMSGATGKFLGEHISLKTYMRIAGTVHSGINFKGAPYYGEIPYAGRRIVAGFNAGLKKRK